MTQSHSLTLQNLTIDLDTFYLHDINLDIAAGEYFAILGPTGAGKTVLLEAIAGLHMLKKGTLLLHGEDVTNCPPETRGIGFVYQDYMLFPHMNVAENIAFGLKLRKAASQVIKTKVNHIGKLLNIDHLLHRAPISLSGGEKQRVALARALVIEPQVLLLDEPLSALDPSTREQLQEELRHLHNRLNTTIIHVTHDFEEAQALGDRIAIMNQGTIAQVGTPEEIFRTPASEFIANFVGMRNIFKGTTRPNKDNQENTKATIAFQDIEITALTTLKGQVHCTIRPEDITLSTDILSPGQINCFEGKITKITPRGAIAYLTVAVPPTFTGLLTMQTLKAMALQEGTRVTLSFKPAAVHVFK